MSESTNPLHQALDWTRQQANSLLHALSSISISKPAAEVATVAEAVFEAVLPAALAAGEQSVASLLTPAHLQTLAMLVGEINATVVKQFLATIPHGEKTPQ